MRNNQAACAALVAWACVACSGSDSPSSRRGDHANLVVLSNAIRLGEDVEWGDLGPFDVRASDGSVAVLDRFAGSIYVVQAEIASRSFGRRGEGPGELTAAGPIVVHDDRVIVFDPDRTSVFSYSGEYLAGATGTGARSAFPWSDSSVAATVRDWTGRGPSWKVLEWHTNLSPDPSTLLRLVDVIGVDPDSLAAGSALFGHSTIGLLGTVRADTSALIRIDHESALATPWPPIARDQAEWTSLERRRYYHEGVREGMYEATIPQMRELFEGMLSRDPERTPESKQRLVPYEDGLGLDDAGNVWAMMRVPYGDRTTLDVFDRAGLRIASVRVPDHVYERVVVKGRWLVGVELDDLDRPSLWRHDLGDVLDRLAGLSP